MHCGTKRVVTRSNSHQPSKFIVLMRGGFAYLIHAAYVDGSDACGKLLAVDGCRHQSCDAWNARYPLNSKYLVGPSLLLIFDIHERDIRVRKGMHGSILSFISVIRFGFRQSFGLALIHPLITTVTIGSDWVWFCLL